MTDEVIVIGFIEEFYTLDFGLTDILVKDIRTKETLTKLSFINRLNKIFGDKWVDAELQAADIASKWYNTNSSIILKELYAYIDKCSVIYDSTSWKIIGPEGTAITIDDVAKTLDTKYNHGFVWNVFKKFVDERQKEIAKGILDEELSKYSLMLGHTNWIIIRNDGVVVEEKELRKKVKFDDMTYIDSYFTRWMLDNTIKESEKMMGL